MCSINKRILCTCNEVADGVDHWTLSGWIGTSPNWGGKPDRDEVHEDILEEYDRYNSDIGFSFMGPLPQPVHADIKRGVAKDITALTEEIPAWLNDTPFDFEHDLKDHDRLTLHLGGNRIIYEYRTKERKKVITKERRFGEDDWEWKWVDCKGHWVLQDYPTTDYDHRSDMDGVLEEILGEVNKYLMGEPYRIWKGFDGFHDSEEEYQVYKAEKDLNWKCQVAWWDMQKIGDGEPATALKCDDGFTNCVDYPLDTNEKVLEHHGVEETQFNEWFVKHDE